MCGITGFIGFDDDVLLRKMSAIIKHRGPDQSGIFTDEHVGLAHRRLSIIDLKDGKQPIHNEDESVWVVYNGEIYNHVSLRNKLEKKGHRFYTNSDTEVIVHAYEEYGLNFASHFNGCFAFALWDKVNKRLVCVRDRVGIKPFYYTIVGNSFLFASEIKSLLIHPDVERAVDMQALNHFMSFRFTPNPSTLFKNIHSLGPGQVLVFEKGSIKLKKYWGVELSKGSIEEKNENYYASKIRELLDDSVRMRLMSEVPLGVYLSGGMDSSSIVASMSKMVDEPIKTFSVGFSDSKYDETKDAQIVADEFGTDHHVLRLESDCMKHLAKAIWHLDTPAVNAASVPTMLLSDFAGKKVKVVLNGDGGDEIFGGYDRYAVGMKLMKYRKIAPSLLRTKVVSPLVRTVLGRRGLYGRFSELMDNLDDDSRMYMCLGSAFTDSEKKNACVNPFDHNIVRSDTFISKCLDDKKMDPLQRM
ncbi:MAG: asparagine synthase (glutamine-hydrolyzing), partial [Candidatus Aenigmarchaeota archaeon]|nr:asparagine synthase (glutamine-hydrolyzing) [Candidatus Aenigmarchaeota archaeon]